MTRPYNCIKDIGCSQEDHLPDCGHYGYTGGYLSNHLPDCPSGNTGPCVCNPRARKRIERAKLVQVKGTDRDGI